MRELALIETDARGVRLLGRVTDADLVHLAAERVAAARAAEARALAEGGAPPDPDGGGDGGPG